MDKGVKGKDEVDRLVWNHFQTLSIVNMETNVGPDESL